MNAAKRLLAVAVLSAPLIGFASTAAHASPPPRLCRTTVTTLKVPHGTSFIVYRITKTDCPGRHWDRWMIEVATPPAG